jgi:hypothetical protein
MAQTTRETGRAETHRLRWAERTGNGTWIRRQLERLAQVPGPRMPADPAGPVHSAAPPGLSLEAEPGVELGLPGKRASLQGC